MKTLFGFLIIESDEVVFNGDIEFGPLTLTPNYIGYGIKCSSYPNRIFLIVDQKESMYKSILYIREIFKLDKQFDTTNKNPFIWFLERLL